MSVIKKRRNFETKKEFDEALTKLENNLMKYNFISKEQQAEEQQAEEPEEQQAEELEEPQEELQAKNQREKFNIIKTQTIKLINRKNNTGVQYLKSVVTTPDYANEELLVTQLNSDLQSDLNNHVNYVRISLFVLMDCIDEIKENDNLKKQIKESIKTIISQKNLGFKPPKQKKEKQQQEVAKKQAEGFKPIHNMFGNFDPPYTGGKKSKRRKTKKPKKRSRKTRKC